jgi:hypothetical protein
MRKLFYAILCLLGTLSGISANAQISQGPVGHWKMDGNAFDSSGFNLHGTATGTTPDTGRTGRPNTALRFNGNSFISIPYSPRYNSAEVSICATIKPTAFNYQSLCQMNMILMRGQMFKSGTFGLMFYDNAFDGGCSNFDTTKNVFAGNISTNTNVSAEQYWQYTPQIQTNKWYTVVMTYDGSVARIYVNGVHKASNPVYVPLGASADGLYIGMNYMANGTSNAWGFNGLIDDITLYNRAISAGEAQAYHSSTALAVPGQVSSGNNIRISPNPVADFLNIEIDQAAAGRMTISNSLGQTMVRQDLNSSLTRIPVAGWPAGQYIIRIETGSTVRHQTFLVR